MSAIQDTSRSRDGKSFTATIYDVLGPGVRSAHIFSEYTSFQRWSIVWTEVTLTVFTVADLPVILFFFFCQVLSIRSTASVFIPLTSSERTPVMPSCTLIGWIVRQYAFLLFKGAIIAS